MPEPGLQGVLMIVDDEPGVRFGIRKYFERLGCRVVEAATGTEALEHARRERPDVVVLDHCLPDGTGLEWLPQLKHQDPLAPVIMLTGNATVGIAVQAIKSGAEHFLIKPVALEALGALVERNLQYRRLCLRAGEADAASEGREALALPLASDLAGEIRHVVEGISPALITGETGTGKTRLARWIHDHGPRAGGPFVDLNCAGLHGDLLENELFGHQRGAFTGATADKPGLLELANGGTVFLDEIGDMPPPLQSRLLKAIDEQSFRRVGGTHEIHVDARFLAATHRDVARLVEEKALREDLYYRLAAFHLHIPPLRDRGAELVAIAERMVGTLAAQLRRPRPVLDPDAMDTLSAYWWPGNLRELRHVLERAILLADSGRILSHHLRFEHREGVRRPPPAAGGTLRDMEIAHLTAVLAETGGNIEAAARTLGISRSTLYQKIARYGLSVPGRDTAG